MEIYGDFYIEDNVIKNIGEFNLELLKEENNIYEVVRINKGEILFLGDHLKRLKTSFDIIDIKFALKKEEIISNIHLLMKKNHKFEGTIKIIFNINNNRGIKSYYYFYKTKSIDIDLYKEGVATSTLLAERKNPNAKVIDSGLRKLADEKIKMDKLFEVILINKKGKITEGSRSNIFFIKNNNIYTPKGGDVLLGVTRKRVIEICKKEGFAVIEDDINIGSIEDMEGAILSSTPYGVIPIKNIEDKKFHLNKNSLALKITGIYMNKYK